MKLLKIVSTKSFLQGLGITKNFRSVTVKHTTIGGRKRLCRHRLKTLLIADNSEFKDF